MKNVHQIQLLPLTITTSYKGKFYFPTSVIIFYFLPYFTLEYFDKLLFLLSRVFTHNYDEWESPYAWKYEKTLSRKFIFCMIISPLNNKKKNITLLSPTEIFCIMKSTSSMRYKPTNIFWIYLDKIPYSMLSQTLSNEVINVIPGLRIVYFIFFYVVSCG